MECCSSNESHYVGQDFVFCVLLCSHEICFLIFLFFFLHSLCILLLLLLLHTVYEHGGIFLPGCLSVFNFVFFNCPRVKKLKPTSNIFVLTLPWEICALLELIFCISMQFVPKKSHPLQMSTCSSVCLLSAVTFCCLYVVIHVCPVSAGGFPPPPTVSPDNWKFLNSAVLCCVLSWMFATPDAFFCRLAPITHGSIKHLSHQASSVLDPTVPLLADFIWLRSWWLVKGPVHSEGTSVPGNLDSNDC